MKYETPPQGSFAGPNPAGMNRHESSAYEARIIQKIRWWGISSIILFFLAVWIACADESEWTPLRLVMPSGRSSAAPQRRSPSSAFRPQGFQHGDGSEEGDFIFTGTDVLAAPLYTGALEVPASVALVARLEGLGSFLSKQLDLFYPSHTTAGPTSLNNASEKIKHEGDDHEAQQRAASSVPGMGFVSLWPGAFQLAYWKLQVHTFLGLGPRVAGTNRSDVRTVLTRPLHSLLHDELSSSFAAGKSSSEEATSGRPLHPSLSSEGVRLAQRWRSLMDDRNASARCHAWSTQAVEQRRVSASVASGMRWILEVDTFDTCIPVDLAAAPTSSAETGSGLSSCSASPSGFSKVATMENFIFHLPSTPTIAGAAAADHLSELYPFSRWISHRRQQKLKEVHKKALKSLKTKKPIASPGRRSDPQDPLAAVEDLQRDAAQHVVLAAHWDTKLQPNGMLGAVDSATSLLMLRQWMQEVQWWRELSALVRTALAETKVQDENEGEVVGESEACAAQLEVLTSGSLLDLTTESEVRALLQRLLSAEDAALLLEYAFPMGIAEAYEATSTGGARRHRPYAGYSLLQWLAAAEALPSLSVLFLDGEEAFVKWDDHDHTYGSRHLADVWRQKEWEPPSSLLHETAPHAGYKNSSAASAPPHSTWYDSIDTFVLLDLVAGSDEAVYRNLFPDTSGHLYQRLVDGENRRRRTRKRFTFLREVQRNGGEGGGDDSPGVELRHSPSAPSSWAAYGVPSLWHQDSHAVQCHADGSTTFISSKSATRCPDYFSVQEGSRPRDRPLFSTEKLLVEDDHMHWLEAGRRRDSGGEADNASASAGPLRVGDMSVAMLHLIALPFPAQWHTPLDDALHVSYDQMVNFYQLFLSFLLFPGKEVFIPRLSTRMCCCCFLFSSVLGMLALSLSIYIYSFVHALLRVFLWETFWVGRALSGLRLFLSPVDSVEPLPGSFHSSFLFLCCFSFSLSLSLSFSLFLSLLLTLVIFLWMNNNQH
eukprot:gene11884-8169_t